MQILLSGNLKIVKKYLNEGSRVGFIPTASEVEDDRWYMQKNRKDLIDMNYIVENIEISMLDKDEILTAFNNSDAIFVAGGNCFYLLQQLKQKGVLEALIDFADKKTYIGVSAGACIACPSIEYVQKLDDKNTAPLLNDYTAMNLTDSYILPHCNENDECYTNLINEIINDYPYLKFIKLTNEQAVIVNGRTDYKIVNTD